jgi:hypothetical protein
MEYKRDIKKVLREKNRLERIVENLGTSPWRIGRTYSPSRDEAAAHIKEAIKHLHQAELELRKYDW